MDDKHNIHTHASKPHKKIKPQGTLRNKRNKRKINKRKKNTREKKEKKKERKRNYIPRKMWYRGTNSTGRPTGERKNTPTAESLWQLRQRWTRIHNRALTSLDTMRILNLNALAAGAQYATKYFEVLFTGVHINQDPIWCIKVVIYMGFWDHRGSWLLCPPVKW